MMTHEILFARHGFSEANRLRVISNRPAHFYPLTESGRAQAEALLGNLRQRDRPITAIYASPITRAAQTADIVAAGLGLEVELADALREPDCGEIEQRGDAAAWAMHARQTRAWQEGDLDYRVPGGESFRDVMGRFLPFVQDVLLRHKDDPGDMVLISHGSVLVNMLPLILPNIQVDFARAQPMGNCAYVAAAVTENGLACLEWCGMPID